MASDVAPPTTTMSPSSEQYIPGDGVKRTSVAQEAEMQRKDRSFQDCIELLMPVYLLPFVFGDKEGTCIYCVLLTVVGLMGRVLPSPVAAILPIVILPLGDVCGVDQLAASYLGPHVLSVCLLFTVAIIGDETTIFFRLCLYTLERYALRMQQLFVCMQLIVFALSLALPSALIVVFSSGFIDRFVSTVHDEIAGPDQRGGVRIRTSSNCVDTARRSRGGRATNVGAPERRVRSVSVVSEASQASGCSSVVRQFKMHPDLQRLEAQDAPRSEQKKETRKTSFGVSERAQRGGDGRPLFLPVRRIRSLSAQPKRPSSILKHSLATTPPPPSPRSELPTPPCPQSSPSAVVVGPEKGQDIFPTTDNRVTSPRGFSRGEECHDVCDQAAISMTRSMQSSVVASPSAPSAFTALQFTSVMSPEASHSVVADASLAVLTSPIPDLPNTVKATKAPPSVRRKGSKRRSPSPKRSKANSKPRRDHEAGASARPREENKQAHNPVQKDSAIISRMPGKIAHQPRDLKDAETKREVREAPQTLKSKEKTVPDINPEAISETVPAPMSAPQSEPRTNPESATVEKEPEGRPEVRGVLKKRYPSLQPSTGSRSGSVPGWNNLSPRGDNVGNPESRTTPQGVSGAEQQASSLRVRALSMVARPAFIAGAAYTAIFGNIASINTLPTRKMVLGTLGCRDDICPVSWKNWLAVSLPVALMCCIVCWTSIYSASLVRCDEGIDERVHSAASKCARLRHRSMKRHTAREALVFYWLMGMPVVSIAYSIQHPGWYLEVPVLGLTVLVLSVAPGSLWRHCWSNRALSWRSLCARMPWNIIFMLGSVMAFTRAVEEYRLVEFGLNKLDDEFWAHRSTRSSQFILVSVAAVLSELVVGESLAQSMATTVVRVAVVTETPVSFYVVPVSLAASINVVLPVSLPLLMMREYLHAKSAQMVAYGVFLKCIAVTAIFISMNTVGLVVFQGDLLPKTPAAIQTLHNFTEINSL